MSVSFQTMKTKIQSVLETTNGYSFNDKCEQFSQRSFTTRDPFYVTIEKYYKLIKTLIMRLGLKRLGKKKEEVFSQVLCNVSNLNSDIQIFLCCRQM